MAIQNFLEGGYYGKLGDTVGQRWKNKRTIRGYVIPENPRTPLQQANRKSFGGVVPLAQMGNAANYHSPAFDLTKNTEWAYRMQAGTELVKGGAQGLNKIPLYPKDFIVPNVISGIKIVGLENNSSLTFEIQGETPTVGKAYSILLRFGNGARAEETLLLNGASTDAMPNTFTCACDNTSEIETADIYARVCSADDVIKETICASAEVLCTKDLSNQFNDEITIVSKEVDTDGNIVVLLSTPNAYTPTTQGTYDIGYFKNSGKAVLKDGTDWTAFANSLTPTIQYENVNGLAGFRVTYSLANYKKTCASWLLNFDIKVYFNNFATQGKEPIMSMRAVTTNAEWLNTQPNYTFTIGNFKRANGSGGYALLYYELQAERPSVTVTPTVEKVSVTGSVYRKEDYDDDNEEWTNPRDASVSGIWQNFSAELDYTNNEICIKVQDYNATRNGKYDISNFTFNFKANKLYTDDTMAIDVDTNIVCTNFPQFLQAEVPEDWLDSFNGISGRGAWTRYSSKAYQAEINNPFVLRSHGIVGAYNYSNEVILEVQSGTFTVGGNTYDVDDEDFVATIELPNALNSADKALLYIEQSVVDAPITAMNIRAYAYCEKTGVYNADYTIRQCADDESTNEFTITL